MLPAATQALTLTVLQQAPTATTAVLAGTVINTRNQPLPNIAVHLVAAGSITDAAPPATTATNGAYEFDNVPPGTYQVEFVDPANKYTPSGTRALQPGPPHNQTRP